MEYTPQQLAKMNDAARLSMILNHSNVIVDGVMCRLVMTSTVANMEAENIERLFRFIGGFDKFTYENDPHSEHDFGAITMDGTLYYFKFDYYDAQLRGYGHENHVMTIMASSDY